MIIMHPYSYAGLVSMGDLEKEDQIEIVINVIIDYFSITRDELFSKVRKHHFVRARMFVAYFLKNCKTVELGKLMGKRDHSTIVYYRQQLTDYLSIGYPEYIKDFNKIKAGINKKHLALSQTLLGE